jgi:GT2 family glycosyltransferase
MKQNELYIILVNWNKPQLTLSCVESLKKSSYKQYKIVIIDNGSIDNSLELLNSKTSDYHLLISDKNLGYTGGNNLGIKYALENDAEFILLLNNDTLVEYNTLEILINTISEDNNIGIVQPKIYYYPEKDVIWCGPTYLNKFLLRPKLVGYKQFGINLYNAKLNLSYAVGCATLIRKEVFLNIGLLDDDFFAVCEDVDFGIRATEAGYQILYVPTSIIYHMESISSGGADNSNYIYLQTRAFLIFINKHCKNRVHFYLVFFTFIFSTTRRIISLLLNSNTKGVYSIIIAFKNFLIGNSKIIQKIN